jgi:hypothetical protein
MCPTFIHLKNVTKGIDKYSFLDYITINYKI